jgi:hypothetical protein
MTGRITKVICCFLKPSRMWLARHVILKKIHVIFGSLNQNTKTPNHKWCQLGENCHKLFVTTHYKYPAALFACLRLNIISIFVFFRVFNCTYLLYSQLRVVGLLLRVFSPQHFQHSLKLTLLKTNGRTLYLKTQFLPRSKRFPPRL